jgi:hypothetical protein
MLVQPLMYDIPAAWYAIAQPLSKAALTIVAGSSATMGLQANSGCTHSVKHFPANYGPRIMTVHEMLRHIATDACCQP